MAHDLSQPPCKVRIILHLLRVLKYVNHEPDLASQQLYGVHRRYQVSANGALLSILVNSLGHIVHSYSLVFALGKVEVQRLKGFGVGVCLIQEDGNLLLVLGLSRAGVHDQEDGILAEALDALLYQQITLDVWHVGGLCDSCTVPTEAVDRGEHLLVGFESSLEEGLLDLYLTIRDLVTDLETVDKLENSVLLLSE